MVTPVTPSYAPAQNSRQCFRLPERSKPVPCVIEIDDTCQQALATLIPFMSCGEEAAVLGFARLSRSQELDRASRMCLEKIADDERRHETLLAGLRQALPAVLQNQTLIARSRQFHLGLADPDPIVSLARIAGLDAAVCSILSRLLARGKPLARSSQVRAILCRIRADEARHVGIASGIVRAATGDRRGLIDEAARVRHALRDILVGTADAFEALDIDSCKLLATIGRIPDRLFDA